MFIGAFIALLIFAGFIVYILISTSRQRDRLLRKYQDPDTVDKIMHNCVWYGQSPDQVADALGRPDQVEQQEIPGRQREIWHYRGGHKRSPRQVVLENGFVVGWE